MSLLNKLSTDSKLSDRRYILIVQNSTLILEESEKNYIEDARPGMLWDTKYNIVSKEIEFIFLDYQDLVVIEKPDNSFETLENKGFMEYSPELKKYIFNGLPVKTSGIYMTCLVKNPEGIFEEAILKITNSAKLNFKEFIKNLVNDPERIEPYYKTCKASTEIFKNDKGSFYIWKFDKNFTKNEPELNKLVQNHLLLLQEREKEKVLIEQKKEVVEAEQTSFDYDI